MPFVQPPLANRALPRPPPLSPRLQRAAHVPPPPWSSSDLLAGTNAVATRVRNHLLLARAAAHEAGRAAALRVVKVTGDGRCLFRAIAKGLAHAGGRPLPAHLERADADALREAAYQQVCVLRRDEFRKKAIVEGDMARYCSQMRDPQFYGGEPEMYALAAVLEVPIEVYIPHPQQRQALVKIVEYGSEFRGEGKKGNGGGGRGGGRRKGTAETAASGRNAIGQDTGVPPPPQQQRDSDEQRARVPVRLAYNGTNHYDVLLPR